MNQSIEELRCDCRPMGDSGMVYIGDCRLHQVVPEITMESLQDSSNPEAKAVLSIITSEKLKLLERIEGEVVGINEPPSEWDRVAKAVRNKFRAEQRQALTKLKAEVKGEVG